VNDGKARVFSCTRQHIGRAADNRIATNDQRSFAGGYACGMDIFWLIGNLYVAQYGSAFLGQASHVEHGNAFLFQMSSHAKQAAYGDDARAAYACNQDTVVALLYGWDDRQRQLWGILFLTTGGWQRCGLLHLCAFGSNEAGTETIYTGKVFVAG